MHKEVDAYFNLRSGSSVALSVELPTEGLVVSLKPEDYHWLYRHFLIGELLDKAAKGYDVAKTWLKDSFGIEVVEDAPPSVLMDSLTVRSADDEKDELTVVSMIKETSKFVGKLGEKRSVGTRCSISRITGDCSS